MKEKKDIYDEKYMTNIMLESSITKERKEMYKKYTRIKNSILGIAYEKARYGFNSMSLFESEYRKELENPKCFSFVMRKIMDLDFIYNEKEQEIGWGDYIIEPINNCRMHVHIIKPFAIAAGFLSEDQIIEEP